MYAANATRIIMDGARKQIRYLFSTHLPAFFIIFIVFLHMY